MQNQDKSIPKYVVLEKSLIGNDLHEAGATVEYDGLPSENLQPTCDVGRARHQEYLKSNAERIARMKDQYTESAVGDPTKFAADFAKALAAQQAEHSAQLAALIEQNHAMTAMFVDAMAKFTGAFQAAAAQVPAPADATAAAPAADANIAAAKPAVKAKADKPGADKTEGEGLV